MDLARLGWLVSRLILFLTGSLWSTVSGKPSGDRAVDLPQRLLSANTSSNLLLSSVPLFSPQDLRPRPEPPRFGPSTIMVNMTVCAQSCSDNCVSYNTPAGHCYNPSKRFPHDPQWGPADTIDVCVSTDNGDRSGSGTAVNRSFFASSDGSCIGRTGGFIVPTEDCVGPFGKPRPMGYFSCDGPSGH